MVPWQSHHITFNDAHFCTLAHFIDIWHTHRHWHNLFEGIKGHCVRNESRVFTTFSCFGGKGSIFLVVNNTNVLAIEIQKSHHHFYPSHHLEPYHDHNLNPHHYHDHCDSWRANSSSSSGSLSWSASSWWLRKLDPYDDDDDCDSLIMTIIIILIIWILKMMMMMIGIAGGPSGLSASWLHSLCKAALSLDRIVNIIIIISIKKLTLMILSQFFVVNIDILDVCSWIVWGYVPNICHTIFISFILSEKGSLFPMWVVVEKSLV